MKNILFVFSLLIFTGCSATWSGVQQDTTNALDWTKGKVNQGAGYVKEKTE
jgi:hypothetical protein